MRLITIKKLIFGSILTFPIIGLASLHCDVTVDNSEDLSNALNTPNQVVCVEAGVYMPHPNDNRGVSFDIGADNITLVGLGASPDDVVLSGNIGDPDSNMDNSKNVVTVKARTGIVIKNLTVADGYNEDTRVNAEQTLGWGAGILLRKSSAMLDHVVVRDNEMAGIAGSGAGIGILNSDIVIKDSVIRDNESLYFGAGFYGRDIGLQPGPGSLTMYNSRVENNIARFNGGTIWLSTGPVLIEGSVFKDNQATGEVAQGDAGAIWILGAVSSVVKNSSF